MTPLVTCISDCACNAALGDLLSAMNLGGGQVRCVVGLLGLPDGSPGPLGSAGECLSQACLGCNCPGVIVPDAGANAEDGAPTFGGGSAGNGECSSTLNETYDGSSYQIICSCPDAKCACFGPTSQVIPYSGCPRCPFWGGPPADDLLAQCGFPH
jgi:hypothetical protein